VGKLLDDYDFRGADLKQLPVVLLGFGKVGQAFASLLEERQGFKREGIELRLAGIFDRGGGVVGMALPLGEIMAAKRTSGTVASVPDLGCPGGRAGDALSSYPHAVLVDASPTDPTSGEPGLSLVREALERGHSAVLASKGPLVSAFAELLDLAQRSKCRLGISAAVGSPLPSLETVHLSLRGSTLRGFRGIFSATANCVLSDMESGVSYQGAVENARRAGILEPDPRLDLEGWDTAFKVLILARSFWSPTLPLEAARVEGITGLAGSDVTRIRESGRKLRLVGTARKGPSGEVAIRVAPEPLAPADPLYLLGPAEKGAEFDSDLMGRFVVWSGKAGPWTTAATLAKDILNIAAHPTPLAL